MDVDSVRPPPLVAAAAAGLLAAGKPLAGAKGVHLATVKVPGLYAPWTARVRGGTARKSGVMMKSESIDDAPSLSLSPSPGRGARLRPEKGGRRHGRPARAQLCAGRVKKEKERWGKILSIDRSFFFYSSHFFPSLLRDPGAGTLPATSERERGGCPAVQRHQTRKKHSVDFFFTSIF